MVRDSCVIWMVREYPHMHFEEHIHTCTYRHEDMRMRGCCIFRGNCYIYVHMYIAMCICGGAAFQSSCESICIALYIDSLKLQVSFAKEPYKRQCILQKRPINLRSLLIVATPYHQRDDACTGKKVPAYSLFYRDLLQKRP